MIFRNRTGSQPTGWQRVAAVDDVPPDELRGVHSDAGPVVLANVDGVIYALEDRCSHQDYPLSDGDLEDGQIECPFHGARFDACTGRATMLPAVAPVRVFEVEIRDGSVHILLA